VAEVENRQDQLKGGLFVQGRILTGKRTGVLKIPEPPSQWDVAGKKPRYLRWNKMWPSKGSPYRGSFGDQVEVTSGLAAGDRVISREASM